jgi:hypothetical protein
MTGGTSGPWPGLRLLLAVAVLVLIGAGIAALAAVPAPGGHGVAAGPGSAAGGGGGGGSPSKPVCPAPRATNTGPLLSGTVLDPPGGFVRQPDGAVNAGVLSEAQVAAVSQNPGRAGAELVRDGFEGADRRVWINGDAGEQIQVTLTQFSCHEGASDYFDNQQAGSFGVSAPEPFVIDGLAGAGGARSTKADAKGHYLQVVGLVNGSIYVQTGAFTTLPDDGALAGAVAATQAAALMPV